MALSEAPCTSPTMKTTQYEYGYDGKFSLLMFIWVMSNSLFHDAPSIVNPLILVGLCILFGAYNYARHMPYKPYLITALVGIGLAVAAWINPDVPFPGRTFFFIVLAGAILYHLWLFLTVGKLFQKNE